MKRASHVPGANVGACLDLRDAPYLQSVLDAIDAVHTDGALPSIKVERAILRPNVGGSYDDNSTPPRIAIARQTLNADLSFLHEVGHFLDHQGIDRAGEYASIHSPLMENWRNAVRQSASIIELQRLQPGGNPMKQEYIDYLLSMKEIFARCYVQYIAFKSQHPGLIACLRDDFLTHALPLPRSRQWQENDFAPISREMDTVFKQRRWIP